jgi:hypothetical protein
MLQFGGTGINQPLYASSNECFVETDELENNYLLPVHMRDRTGVRFPIKANFFLLHSVQTGSLVHPPVCSMNTGVPSPGG